MRKSKGNSIRIAERKMPGLGKRELISFEMTARCFHFEAWFQICFTFVV
jgi:hypothetical protein